MKFGRRVNSFSYLKCGMTDFAKSFKPFSDGKS